MLIKLIYKVIRRYFTCIVSLFFFLFVIQQVVAQNRSELENTKNKIMGDIHVTQKLIEETRGRKVNTLAELQLIDAQIRNREKILINLQKEIKLTEDEIMVNKKLIQSLEDDLKKMKEEYGKLIYNAYKNRQEENFLLFVLSAESFNQSYKRIKYMGQYRAYKQRQAELILAYRKVIEKKNNELSAIIAEKENLIKQVEKEHLEIVRNKQNKNLIIRELSVREKGLIAELNAKEELAKKLQMEIERIIELERKKSVKADMYAALTPAEKLISDEFGRNHGRLPWPTGQGVIVGKYGLHPHPVKPGLKVRNDGIFISAPAGTEVRAIFNGYVSKIFSIPGSNFAIIIKHGNYYTLYHNISSVYVKEGEKVSTKQAIGKIYTDPDKNETVLQFQVWKEMERNDPEKWLAN